MHGTRRQKRQITPVSEWHTRPFCTALSRSRAAQHNELNQNESRGGGRKLIRFGFPIRGKKTSIENRDMDQWRRKQRTGVCLTVIVIPSSALESSFYHRIVSSFCDIHRITDGWRRGETVTQRGEDPLQPQLCYSLRELYVALKARKDKPKNLAAQPLHRPFMLSEMARKIEMGLHHAGCRMSNTC